ncbi:hypothetical protein AB0E63_43470 [Kribbella sp. NPDC026596]|uniref:hypothetical protein n=1 Tax=Kribbella sp. NPDC026596 TaxID=3155122 RepID=UPI0033E190C0
MADKGHSLATCRLPLSALTRYYRLNLELPIDSSAPRRSWSFARRHDVAVQVGSGAIGPQPNYVTVTVVEFAAHVAYLDTVTGTGLFVAPPPDTDLVAPDDWFVEAAWPDRRDGYGRTAGLSLQTADRVHALEELERHGWRPLDDENGVIQPGGRTRDGRLAVCLRAERVLSAPLVLEGLQQAVTALCAAADLRHDGCLTTEGGPSRIRKLPPERR